MQSPALVIMEGAEETDIVGNIKTLKRKALRNQQQLLGKMDEVQQPPQTPPSIFHSSEPLQKLVFALLHACTACTMDLWKLLSA